MAFGRESSQMLERNIKESLVAISEVIGVYLDRLAEAPSDGQAYRELCRNIDLFKGMLDAYKSAFPE